VNRILIVLGAVLVVAGLLWPWLKKMHLFHLPGDIVIDRPGFKFFLPITTMLIVSALLSIVAWLLRCYDGSPQVMAACQFASELPMYL
jgi:hypothetical protein